MVIVFLVSFPCWELCTSVVSRSGRLELTHSSLALILLPRNILNYPKYCELHGFQDSLPSEHFKMFFPLIFLLQTELPLCEFQSFSCCLCKHLTAQLLTLHFPTLSLSSQHAAIFSTPCWFFMQDCICLSKSHSFLFSPLYKIIRGQSSPQFCDSGCSA